MDESRLLKPGFLILFLSVFCSLHSAHAAGPAPSDPWISLEKNLIQLHKQYAPDSALLNAPTFSAQVEAYLDAGLWSSAEALLSKAPALPAEDLRALWLSLYLKRGAYEKVYAAYQKYPLLFKAHSDRMVGAIQGALAKKEYAAALSLLKSRDHSARSNPEQLYFSALAYWGLKEHNRLDATLKEAVLWANAHPDSSWAERMHLLKVYYHLNQKEYDLAFTSMGNLFDNNTDLALLALTWGYFKLGASSNLFSILQAVDAASAQSPYHSQIYRILSRFLIQEGNLRGAVEMDQRERDALQSQMKILEEETALLRRGISTSSRSNPPGAQLAETLSRLQQEVGEKREMKPLFWYIDLQQRRQLLNQLKNRERMIDQEQRRLQLEMVQRCLSLKRHEAALLLEDNLDTQNRTGDSPIPLETTQDLYQKARAAFQAGQVDIALPLLKTILQESPHTPYADESAFRLGDAAFDRRDYATAIKYFQLLEDRKDSPLRSLALYKLAWAFYLSEKPAETISVLVKQETEPPENQDKKGVCVMVRTPQERREPYRLLALAVRKLGDPNQLIQHVQGIDPENGYAFYKKVAEHYQAENKADEMFRIIRSWINTYPNYQKTPLLHEKMVRLIKQTEDVSLDTVVSARTAFVNRYRPGSPWSMHNEATDENGIKPLLKKHLLFLMTHHYAESQKTRTEQANKAVLTWYLYYLDLFPDEKEIGKDRYLYAETLNKLNAIEKAAEAFRMSAYEDPPHSLSAEAGFHEILLLEKMHAVDSPETEAGYLRFASRFADDHRSKEIAMRLAEFAFQRGDYEKSRFYAKQASPEFQNHMASRELDLAAKRLVVQAFLKEKSYRDAITFIHQLMTKNRAPVIQKEFKPLLVLSYFQQGEALKHQGLDEEAAASFWKAYQFGDGDEISGFSLFEAAVLWDHPHSIDKSESAFHLYSIRYPKSALYHTALIRLAGIYERTERLLKGAQTYETVARLPKLSPEWAHNALEQAILLYEAEEVWEKVIPLAMERADVIPANGTTPREKEDRGRWMLTAAEAGFRLGKSVTALNILNQLANEHALEDQVYPHVAKAHFIIAEWTRDDFEDIELVAPLQENLQKKKSLFEQLLVNYDYAVAHPSPQIALNANYRIGTLFEHFSRSLLESERPEDLSFEEEALYEDLLLEQALPYFEKAEEAYRQNIQIAEETGLDNEWVVKSQMHLFMIQQQIDIFTRGGQEVLG